MTELLPWPDACRFSGCSLAEFVIVQLTEYRADGLLGVVLIGKRALSDIGYGVTVIELVCELPTARGRLVFPAYTGHGSYGETGSMSTSAHDVLGSRNMNSPDPSTENNVFDLIIVGLGPAGAAAANLAGMYGLRTLVIERDDDVFPRQRAMVLDDEALRILRNIGLYEEATAHMHRGVGLRFLGLGGKEVMVGWPEVTEACGESQVNFFHQPWLEATLRTGIDRWPTVTVRTGSEANEVEQDREGVTVRTTEIATGAHVDFHGAYLLACDGGSSPIRKQLGISFDGSSYAEQWIDVQATTRRPLHTAPMFEFYCDPERPGVTAPCPAGHYRWEWRVNAGEDADKLLEPDSIWNLLADRGVGPEDIDITRTWSYTFHVRKCARWRVDRVILAGDAAHVMPPFAGQGISGALRDVMNVTWKIAAVIRGQAGEWLLDSYQAEREPQHDRATASAVNIGRMVLISNRYLAWARDRAFRTALRFPSVEKRVRRAMSANHPLVDGFLAETKNSTVEGHLLRAVTVAESKIHMVHVDDAIGPRWAILGLDIDPSAELPASTRAAWDVFTPIYLTIRPGTSVVGPGELGDPTGLFWKWMKENGVRFVAVRPDRYVYAAAYEAADLATPAAGAAKFATV